MTSRERTFPVDGPIRLLVRMRSSDISVTVTETDAATVTFTGNPDLAARVRVELVDGRLEIEAPLARTGFFTSFGGAKMGVAVTIPARTDAVLETGSGSIRTTGDLGAVEATCGSGDVAVGTAASVRATTGSGAITLTEADEARLRTGSGRITAEAVRTIEASSGSGDVIVGTLGEWAALKSGSGNHLVRHVAHGEITAKTASGDIAVGVARGTAAMLDCSTVSGTVRSELEPGDAPEEGAETVALRLRSVSGKVSVRRA
ncbi:DUF4097 domain-containing protein [Ruania suaedae]|uniref:DUF4097 family beta strand repeat-containing protein n=1 Tax=Ruania suaedae TaxID=2897774 RepID=UPI001E3F7455|nr:DUF4097 family beta strand repeat-containing protein [Ruania suaedae]UFU02058.1 DUF4097 domain-containing protein [Ruania suaedae]